MVSAWASRQHLVLGQQVVAGKSNEITAIPLPLGRLALTGALVTIDAIGTQNKISDIILARGGGDLLVLNANRPAMVNDVRDCFADPACVLDSLQTTDADHGRIEVRRHAVCHDIGWLISDRRYAGEPAFPGFAAIAMIEAETERDGKTSRERRYYLSSAPLDAKTFARAVRAHWHIENRQHWVLDVLFHDDLVRLKTGYGPENMAVVKHMAMNILRLAKPTISLKNRRKLAGRIFNHLIKGAD